MRFDEICFAFREAGIENAETEAALLLEKFCSVAPSALPFKKSENFESPALAAATQKRLTGYPLQYILGEWYFWREKYIVNESCLVPRSDTELLVEKAIERLPKNAAFADLCTGSGCIAISVLASRVDCSAYGFDLYEKTLETARLNSSLNGVSDRLTLCLSDVLQPIRIEGEPIFDAILSNPPYIPSADIEGLSPEVKNEPRAALDGGEDGLDFYRAILSHQLHLLKNDGFIAFEIGYDQGDDICTLATEHGFCCEIIKDYSGNDRVAFLKKSI